MSVSKNARLLLLLPAALFAGCNMVLLHPAGAVAAQQGHLIVVATLLMLLVIVPVMALTVLFAWRYRKSNTRATYTPDWDHSTQLELVIWSAPLLIIIALGAVTWISTHTLDPYRPLRVPTLEASGRGPPAMQGSRGLPPEASSVGGLTVEVVALDWKWLFIYPEQGIAVVNDLAAPVDVPITFKITASSVMNSFFIPALAGQVYAMPGMQTQLHAVINHAGDYEGFSANYSGAGFSDMRFRFHGMSQGDFTRWVQAARASTNTLDRAGYLQLERPSKREPVRRYASVAPGLYDAIIDRSVTGMDRTPAMDTNRVTGANMATGARTVNVLAAANKIHSAGRAP
jgi:cytochrome o ubiquinol oxidase subunit 2